MRTLALLALVVAALACGADAPPSCGAPGLVRACACVGGAQGAQECSPGGAWSVCACPDGGAAEAGSDAGSDGGLDAAGDAPAEVGADAAAEMPPDAPEDARPPTEDRLADGGCPEGYAQCVGSTCVNLMTSRMWCGSCASFCGAAASCIGGRCVTTATGVSCDVGRGDCDGNVANGCEVDTRADGVNCGGCGRACGGRKGCIDGQCLVRP